MISTQLAILHDSIDYSFDVQSLHVAALAYELYHDSEGDEWTVCVLYKNTTYGEEFYPVNVCTFVGSWRSVCVHVLIEFPFANAHNFAL